MKTVTEWELVLTLRHHDSWIPGNMIVHRYSSLEPTVEKLKDLKDEPGFDEHYRSYLIRSRDVTYSDWSVLP